MGDSCSVSMLSFAMQGKILFSYRTTIVQRSHPPCRTPIMDILCVRARGGNRIK